MKIVVDGVEHNIGYALWRPGRLDGETDRQFLERIQAIDAALRECDNKRLIKE